MMNQKTELEKVSEETMRFMRGKYALDEVQGKYYDIDCLKFRQGKKTAGQRVPQSDTRPL